MVTPASDVGRKVWDASGNEALGGWVAGVIDARDATIKKQAADLRRAEEALEAIDPMLNDEQFDVLMKWARRHDWLSATRTYRAARQGESEGVG